MGIPYIFVDIPVGFQGDLKLAIATWFLAVRCAEIEVLVVVFWEESARVYLLAFEHLFVDCEVRL